MFDPRAGFSGTVDRMDLLPVAPNPTWKISNGHISGTGHPIHFVFDSRVGFSRSSDRISLFPVGPNPRSRPSAVLHNFEWPYI